MVVNTGFTIIIGLFGGLGLFLLGIQLLGDGLQRAAGERMRRILEMFTSHPLKAVLTGAAVTALLQSSSTTTVMIVGFVNSGLMTLTQAVGTIMGANIGTTITAQLVSFNIYSLAYPLIAVGALFFYFSRKKLQRYAGMGMLGFGLLLLGLSTMSSAVSPVREYEPFLQLLVAIGDRPILGILGRTFHSNYPKLQCHYRFSHCLLLAGNLESSGRFGFDCRRQPGNLYHGAFSIPKFLGDRQANCHGPCAV